MEAAPVAPLGQPRAIGEVRLSVRNGPRGTAIAGLRQSGAFKAVFPRVTGAGSVPPLEAVLVNTAGGITGGDRFSCSLQAEAGSHLRLTTQAAERAYRAQPGETGRVANRLTVAAGARLDWLPQETILFEGCRLERSLVAELAPGARLLLVEPLVFGRALMGESLHAARFRDRIEIRREGVPLYLDALRFEGDVAAQLARPAVAEGAGALASLVLVAPDAAAHLAPLRAILPAMGGASLLAEDVLALRLLAPDSYHLRKVLIPVLSRLTQALPRSWMT
ncbi:urease accessory protein UreD [Rhodovulum sulfidophilum]|uniref:urease accessory protein UreD n=1 Tax=Rhodovulum sulfidophilum TaxID=35806 RepID=UPI00095165E1|nr:urease accessory protein UreD [Rhodovulum sulfidophilum]OLS52208.1 urease accessory protein [Rhodovulum sulfidophilum]